jgi:hypothetical protein
MTAVESRDVDSGRLQVPSLRGPMGEQLIQTLRHPPDATDASALRQVIGDHLRTAGGYATQDEDLQHTLLCLYELHYRGLEGVNDRWEWHPGLLAARAVLEDNFEADLRARIPAPELDRSDARSVAESLFAMTADDDGPSLSRFVAKKATEEQLREFLILRSVYQLKEADPHTWAIPRLSGAPKAALVEIQADEYGDGRPERMHSALFAQAMRGLGLDDTYGAYVDLVPASTLASLNMMSMFGLHRRLRGAIVGHLAAFEMTSSIPNKLYGNGFRRLGHDSTTTRYFDEHVEADAVHEQIAGRDLAGRLAAQEPALLPDILFGAAACLAVDGWAGGNTLDAWEHQASALRSPGPA